MRSQTHFLTFFCAFFFTAFIRVLYAKKIKNNNTRFKGAPDFGKMHVSWRVLAEKRFKKSWKFTFYIPGIVRELKKSVGVVHSLKNDWKKTQIPLLARGFFVLRHNRTPYFAKFRDMLKSVFFCIFQFGRGSVWPKKWEKKRKK